MEQNHSSSKSNKKQLGRGLASLLETDDEFFFSKDFLGKEDDYNNEYEIKKLSIYDIDVNLDQPRKYFDEVKLRELSESIKNNGLLQPIIVSKGRDDKYIIVAGERRYRACKLAGLKEIRAIVLDLQKQEIIKKAVIENVQRENLNPIEEANGYRNIIDAFGYTHEQLASEVGKSRAYITNLLRILTLPKDVQSAIRDKSITLGHAKVLLGVDKPSEYLSKIIKDHLSVRQLETIIFNDLSDIVNNSVFTAIHDKNEENDVENKDNSTNNNYKNDELKHMKNDIKFIEKQLSDKFGFKVRLKLKRDGSGKFEISFSNSDDLFKIIELLK